MNTLFTAYLFSSIFLCGLIWVIQLVHYPSFRFIDSSQFVRFENFHCRRISMIVAPMMLLEVFSAAGLFYFEQSFFWSIHMIGLFFIWASTFFIQSKLHSNLLKSMNVKTIDFLILSNWFRTILWTLKAVSLLAFPTFPTP